MSTRSGAALVNDIVQFFNQPAQRPASRELRGNAAMSVQTAINLCTFLLGVDANDPSCLVVKRNLRKKVAPFAVNLNDKQVLHFDDLPAVLLGTVSQQLRFSDMVELRKTFGFRIVEPASIAADVSALVTRASGPANTSDIVVAAAAAAAATPSLGETIVAYTALSHDELANRLAHTEKRLRDSQAIVKTTRARNRKQKQRLIVAASTANVLKDRYSSLVALVNFRPKKRNISVVGGYNLATLWATGGISAAGLAHVVGGAAHQGLLGESTFRS